MQTNTFIARTVLVMTICSGGWSFASEDATPVDTLRLVATSELQVARVEAAPVAVAGFGVPLASGELEGLRGGFEVVKNDNQLSGTVADNVASNLRTGNNSIAEGSFSNASGLPMVIQNSGSNVLIQNATIINVQYQ